MKTILNIIFWLAIPMTTLCQIPYYHVFNSPNDEDVWNVKEGNNGNVYIISHTNNNAYHSPQDSYKSSLIKVDSQGNLVDSITYDSTYSSAHYIRLWCLEMFSNNVFVCGTAHNYLSGENEFYLAKFDANLNLIFEKFILDSITLPIYVNTMILSDDSIIFLVGASNNPQYLPYKSCFVSKFDLNGNNYIRFLTSGSPVTNAITDLPKINKVIFENGPDNFIFSLNRDSLNNLDTIFKYLNVWPNPDYFFSIGFHVFKNDTSFYEFGHFYESPISGFTDVRANVRDYHGVLIDSIQFGSPDTNDQACFTIDQSKTGMLFIGGTKNFNLPDEDYLPNENRWFEIQKMNPDTKQIFWKRVFGGDANYILYFVTSLSDGGVLLCGTKYDWHTDSINKKRNIILVKIDSAGNVPDGVPELEIRNENLLCYPNPFATSLTLQLPENLVNAEIQLYDIVGKQVMETLVTGTKTVLNTSELVKGIYIVKVVSGDKATFVSKAIKN